MGGKTSTTQQQQTTTIPPEVLARYNAVNARAEQTANIPFQTYSTDPNAFVAPLTPVQQAAIGNIAGLQGAYAPFYGAGAALTGQAVAQAQPLTGGQIGQYMSPYLGTVLGAQAALQNQANQQAMSGQLANAIRSGAFGGDRAGIAAANLAQQQQLANAQIYSGILNQGYQQALSAAQQQQQLRAQTALQAGQQIAGLGTGLTQAGLGAAQALLGAGTAQQQTQQAGLQALYNQFLQQQAYPFQTTQFLANIAEGTGALSGSTTAGTTTQPQSFFGNISDERVKEDIHPVGKTNDGQTIYKFRYKDDPEKTTHMGLLAQEVEKHKPEAVGEVSGIKTVNYDKATEDAERHHREYGGLVPESMGGPVTPESAGLGFAAGGSPGGLVDSSDLAAILNAQRQALGMYGAQGAPYGSPIGATTPGGRSGIVPPPSLPVSKLATGNLPSPPRQEQISPSQLAGTIKTGTELYDWWNKPSKEASSTSYDKPAENQTSATDTSAPTATGDKVSELYTPDYSSAYRGGVIRRDVGGAIPYQGQENKQYFPEQILDSSSEDQKKLDTPKLPGVGQQPSGMQNLQNAMSIGKMGMQLGEAAGEMLPLLFLARGGVAGRHGHAYGDAVDMPDNPPLDSSSLMPVDPAVKAEQDYQERIKRSGLGGIEGGGPSAFMQASQRREQEALQRAQAPQDAFGSVPSPEATLGQRLANLVGFRRLPAASEEELKSAVPLMEFPAVRGSRERPEQLRRELGIPDISGDVFAGAAAPLYSGAEPSEVWTGKGVAPPAAAAAPPPPVSPQRRAFTSDEIQSNNRPVINPDGTINWGNPDQPQDFVRASSALKQITGGVASTQAAQDIYEGRQAAGVAPAAAPAPVAGVVPALPEAKIAPKLKTFDAYEGRQPSTLGMPPGFPRPRSQSAADIANANADIIGKIAEEKGWKTDTWNPQQISNLVAQESGGRNLPPNRYGFAGYFQLQTDPNKKGFMGVTWDQMQNMPFDQQARLYSDYLTKFKYSGSENLGVMNAAPAFANKPDDTIVYRANSREAQANPQWVLYSNANGDVTVGGLKAWQEAGGQRAQTQIAARPSEEVRQAGIAAAPAAGAPAGVAGATAFAPEVGAGAPMGGGLTPPTNPVTGTPFKSWGEFASSRQFIIPLLQGIGAMASSPSRYLGAALLQGVGAGAGAYQKEAESQAQLAQRQQVVQRAQFENQDTAMKAWQGYKALTRSQISFPDYLRLVQSGQISAPAGAYQFAQTVSGGPAAPQAPSVSPQAPAAQPPAGTQAAPAQPAPTAEGQIPPAKPYEYTTDELNSATVTYSNGAQIPANRDPVYLRNFISNNAQAAAATPFVAQPVTAAIEELKRIEQSKKTYDISGKEIYLPTAAAAQTEAAVSDADAKTTAQFVEDQSRYASAYRDARQQLDWLDKIYKDYEGGRAADKIAYLSGIMRQIGVNMDDPNVKRMLPAGWGDTTAGYDAAVKVATQQIMNNMQSLAIRGAPATEMQTIGRTVAMPTLDARARRDLIVHAKAALEATKDMYEGYDPDKRESARKYLVRYQGQFKDPKAYEEKYLKAAEKETPQYAGASGRPTMTREQAIEEARRRKISLD